MDERHPNALNGKPVKMDIAMESFIAVSILILSGFIVVVWVPLSSRCIYRSLRITSVPIDDTLPVVMRDLIAYPLGSGRPDRNHRR